MYPRPLEYVHVDSVAEALTALGAVEAPERCTIVIEGKGDKGTIAGRGAMRLTDPTTAPRSPTTARSSSWDR